VVVPPRATQPGSDQFSPGVVRLRHDAYPAVGRLEPKRPEPDTLSGVISRAAGGDEPFVKIAWEDQTYLRAGEVVLIFSTSSRGVLAHRIGRGPMSLPVSRDERTWAFGMLGIEKPEYFHPEAAAGLYDVVFNVANALLPIQFPGPAGSTPVSQVEVIESEDGVIVVDQRPGGPPGRRIVLFRKELLDTMLQGPSGIPR
jgi:hypothetical protein